MLRALRHAALARVTDFAVSLAPRLSEQGADRVARVGGRLARHLPVVATNVAQNMRAASVYSHQVWREYFTQLGHHFGGALQALRCGGDHHAELVTLAHQRIELDDSIDAVRRAAGAGRGVIIVGPHINNYLLNLARLNAEIPLTVYLRHARDPRRLRAKQRWYAASGVQWIAEPAGASGPLGRLGRMAAALHAGQVLFITPDLPQKEADGVPVRLFNRTVFLPGGAGLLALRSGAEMFMLTAQPAGTRQRLIVDGPAAVEPAPRGKIARQRAVQEYLQFFATRFEEFLRRSPALWYLWGDKRWTRLWHGDTRYARPDNGAQRADALLSAARVS